MSDGPHRTLRLPPRWKQVAASASNSAFSIGEVAERLRAALAEESRRMPLEKASRILDDEQRSLFPDAMTLRLDALRSECRGDSAANVLIDSLIEAVRGGEAGNAALHDGLEKGLERIAQSHSRSIEEHYARGAGDRSSLVMRDRLGSVCGSMDFKRMAIEFAAAAASESRPRPFIEKHSGIDEGPAL